MFAALLTLVSALPLVAPEMAAVETAQAAATSTDAAQSADVSATVIRLAHEWVQTWNERNLERMQQLHGPGMLYGFGDRFVTGEALIEDLRRENFWGLSWSLRATNMHVRILSPEAVLVSFRLVGQEFRGDRARPYLALFTLVFQRQGDWKIVHVHDSDGAASVSPTPQSER
jgi:Domain of unknown function (DUF4440)